MTVFLVFLIPFFGSNKIPKLKPVRAFIDADHSSATEFVVDRMQETCKNIHLRAAASKMMRPPLSLVCKPRSHRSAYAHGAGRGGLRAKLPNACAEYHQPSSHVPIVPALRPPPLSPRFL